MKRRTASLAISLVAPMLLEVLGLTPASAEPSDTLWVADGRFGGWGWSRSTGLENIVRFLPLQGEPPVQPQGCGYWYPAYEYSYLLGRPVCACSCPR